MSNITLLAPKEAKSTIHSLARLANVSVKEIYSQTWHSGITLPNGSKLQAFKRNGHTCYRVVKFN